MNMDPNQFYFLILPLAVLVFTLVIVVVYYARKENNISHMEIQIVNELMRTGVGDKVKFSTALQGLVNDNLIDRNSFERIGKLFEDYFTNPEKQ